MNYQTADQALTITRQRAGQPSLERIDSRNIPSIRSTRLQRNEDGSISLIYHWTAVITWYPDGRTVLDHNHYTTPTTKARINAYLDRYQVFQNDWTWYIWDTHDPDAPAVRWDSRTFTLPDDFREPEEFRAD